MCESECFRIESGLGEGCIMSPWLFNMYIDSMMKVGMGKMGIWLMEEGRESRLPGLLYADDLVFCGKFEEDLKVMVGCFVEVCRIGV